MFFAMSSDHGSVMVTWVVVNQHGVADIYGKKRPRNKDAALYKITKKYMYYSNKGSPDFHGMVIFLEGMCATIYIVPMMWYLRFE